MDRKRMKASMKGLPFEQEPDFKTYAEYEDWKFQQKMDREQQKEQYKR